MNHRLGFGARQNLRYGPARLVTKLDESSSTSIRNRSQGTNRRQPGSLRMGRLGGSKGSSWAGRVRRGFAADSSSTGFPSTMETTIDPDRIQLIRLMRRLQGILLQ